MNNSHSGEGGAALGVPGSGDAERATNAQYAGSMNTGNTLVSHRFLNVNTNANAGVNGGIPLPLAHPGEGVNHHQVMQDVIGSEQQGDNGVNLSVVNGNAKSASPLPLSGAGDQAFLWVSNAPNPNPTTEESHKVHGAQPEAAAASRSPLYLPVNVEAHTPVHTRNQNAVSQNRPQNPRDKKKATEQQRSQFTSMVNASRQQAAATNREQAQAHLERIRSSAKNGINNYNFLHKNRASVAGGVGGADTVGVGHQLPPANSNSSSMGGLTKPPNMGSSSTKALHGGHGGHGHGQGGTSVRMSYEPMMVKTVANNS